MWDFNCFYGRKKLLFKKGNGKYQSEWHVKITVSSSIFRYDANLELARSVGVKKSITTNVSLGVSQFLIFGSYALAFWYGTKLTAEEKENYDIGHVLIVSIAMQLEKCSANSRKYWYVSSTYDYPYFLLSAC